MARRPFRYAESRNGSRQGSSLSSSRGTRVCLPERSEPVLCRLYEKQAPMEGAGLACGAVVSPRAGLANENARAEKVLQPNTGGHHQTHTALSKGTMKLHALC